MPLRSFEDGPGRWLVVASVAGSPKNPAWLHNLKAHPDEVSWRIGRTTWPVSASTLSPEERAQVWPRIVREQSNFAGHQEATDRVIPSCASPGGTPEMAAEGGTRRPDVELSMEEIRAVTAYALACAEPVLSVFEQACPDDLRPAEALAAARVFAQGEPRSRRQRAAAPAAHRAGVDAPTQAARHAAIAAGDAAASAYLHPLAKPSQVRHILGSAAHAARAGELSRGDDPVVAEYLLYNAQTRATPVVREVLGRYPRAPRGRTRVAELMQRLDGLLRDPPPPPRVVDDAGPFFHGTRADVEPGDLLTPGWLTNYGTGKTARHLYLTASETGAPLAAALAQGDGPPRVYRVEPLGVIHDDPNVTDKRFPGNPTRSYRTTEPLRVLEEVHGFDLPDPDLIARMRASTSELRELGIEAMD